MSPSPAGGSQQRKLNRNWRVIILPGFDGPLRGGGKRKEGGKGKGGMRRKGREENTPEINLWWLGARCTLFTCTRGKRLLLLLLLLLPLTLIVQRNVAFCPTETLTLLGYGAISDALDSLVSAA